MNLITKLKNKNIIKFGDFTLRSGIKSNYYCDIKEAFGDPKILKVLVKDLTKIIPKNTTSIACAGYGGVTLGSLIAYKLNFPLSLVRDVIKNHGIKKTIDGYIPTKNDIVCIIDDVFTTGSSIRDTKEKLLFTKAKFTKPIVVLNRSKEKSIISLIKDTDIKN